MEVPETIDGLAVLEYGFFRTPIFPKGYVPPPDGRPPLKAVQNVAICTSPEVEGYYYVLFCTPEWEYVTYSYSEMLEYAKLTTIDEFGQDVVEWRVRA